MSYDPGRLLFGGAKGLEAVAHCLRLIAISAADTAAAKTKKQTPDGVRSDCNSQRLTTSFVRNKSVDKAIPFGRRCRVNIDRGLHSAKWLLELAPPSRKVKAISLMDPGVMKRFAFA